MSLKANNIPICAILNTLIVQYPGPPLQIGVTVPVHRFGCPLSSIWPTCMSSCIPSAFSSRCDGHLSVGLQVSQIQESLQTSGLNAHCSPLTHLASFCFVLAVWYASRKEVFCCCVHGNSTLKERKEALENKCL